MDHRPGDRPRRRHVQRAGLNTTTPAGGDPAEVLQPRQAAVLDNEVEVGEVGGRVVDVGDVGGVPVQRPDGRALVNVDVSDAQFLAGLEVAVGPRVVEAGLVGLAEATVVELEEVGRLEDGVVDVAVGEQIFHQQLAALVQVFLGIPRRTTARSPVRGCGGSRRSSR